MFKNINRWIVVILGVFFVVVVAACGPAATEEPTEEGSEEEPMDEDDMEDDMEDGELSGDVLVDGSSTVFPVTSGVAEDFADVAPDVNVSVGLSGTGGGFEKFCPGETDISNASRP
ncbi:MAG: substrate-binding domain-containing protein, partial [Anaerolineae bacterium]